MRRYSSASIVMSGNVHGLLSSKISVKLQLFNEISSEPWFTVGADDIFPEEFKKFFRFPDEISTKFEHAHGDLCNPEMWIELQERNQSPDPGEFFPYSEQARFNLPE